MNFFARFNMPDFDGVPVRAYVHNAGRDLWTLGDEEEITAAKRHLLESLGSLSGLNQLDYLLAVMWGKLDVKAASCVGGYRMIDCFGYSDVPKDPMHWPGNPDVESWTMQDGVYVKKNKIIPGGTTCEDSLILLGEEAKYRRDCHNLREYVMNAPRLKGLGKIIEGQ